jgi:hypothetical protein
VGATRFTPGAALAPRPSLKKFHGHIPVIQVKIKIKSPNGSYTLLAGPRNPYRWVHLALMYSFCPPMSGPENDLWHGSDICFCKLNATAVLQVEH